MGVSHLMKQVIFACLFAVAAFQLADARRGSNGKGRGKGKGGKGGAHAEKMTEMCENPEKGSDIAFKCNCFSIMKIKKDDRSEEQQAAAKECLEKRKERKDERKEEKKENKENKDAEASDDDSESDKKQSWKSRVKACRQARKAIKEGHANEQQISFAEEK